MATLTISAGSLAAISTTDDILLIGAPGSVVQGSLEANDTIYLFFESEGTLPGSGLEVDITAPGTYTGAGTNANSTIFGEYRSYLLHFDPVGDDGGLQFAVGEVTFDEDIIGIIIDAVDLDGSDATVGAPGTAYPVADGTRGLDNGDTLDWEITLLGPRSLDVALLTSSFGMDQVRVITRAPEPGTYATLGMFLLFAACAKRRRAQSPSVA
jgi:hypothetical protein